MSTRSHVFPQQLSKYEILQKFIKSTSEYERWIPPISHATVCGKRQGRAQAGGPLPERGWRGRIWVDMRMYEEEPGCMRALKAFYKLGRTSMAFNSTRRVETFWPCRTRAWFNDYRTKGKTYTGPNVQTANWIKEAKYQPQLLQIKVKREVCWPWNATNKHLELELRSLRGKCNM